MTTHRNKQWQATSLSQTNGRMLPQSCPLEAAQISAKADNEPQTAGPVHCQGEREPAKAGSPLPSQQCDETDRVTGPRVFTLAKNKTPLMPCHPARARVFLAKGRAVVARLLPFAIRLKDRNAGITQPISQCRLAQRADGYNSPRQAIGVPV